jgi:hypothetical protein
VPPSSVEISPLTGKPRLSGSLRSVLSALPVQTSTVGLLISPAIF